MVGLLATGGSTNHTIHLVAMARAAGMVIDWNDFADLSAVVPLLARIYPNGPADVNHFHAAGGMGFLIRELLAPGCCTQTWPPWPATGLRAMPTSPGSTGGQLALASRHPITSGDLEVLRPVGDPSTPTAASGC